MELHPHDAASFFSSSALGPIHLFSQKKWMMTRQTLGPSFCTFEAWNEQ